MTPKEHAAQTVAKWIARGEDGPREIDHIPMPDATTQELWTYIHEVRRLTAQACIHWTECEYRRGGCCSIDAGEPVKHQYCMEGCTERSYKSKGLGDTVKKAINKVTRGKLRPKKNCGCNKRRKKLNDIFPYDKGDR